MITLLLLLAVGVGQQQPIDDAIDHLNCAMGHLDRMTQILDCKDSSCLEKLCPHGKCPKPKSCIPHQPQVLTQATAPIVGKSAPVSLACGSGCAITPIAGPKI